MAETKKKQRNGYCWWILVACCFLMLGGQGIIGNCAGIMYGPVAQSLGVGRGEISLYMTIANIACCVALPLAGKYLAIWNIRIVLPVAMTIICANCALMSLYTQVWMWYISGVIQGFGMAFIFLVPAPLILSNWFKKRLGFAVGLAMAFSGLGGIVFNPIISAALANWDWHMAYLVYAGLAWIVSMPFLLFVIRYKPEDMGLKPYGYEEGEEDKAKESDLTEPGGVTLKNAMFKPAWWMVIVAIGAIALFTTYYQHFSGFATSIGWATVAAGTLVSAVSFGNMAWKFLYGILADVMGTKASTILMTCVAAVGFVILLTMQSNTIMMYVGAVCFGSTLALCAVGAPLITKAIFGEKNYSEIFAQMSMCTYLVGAVGMSGVGFLYDISGSYDLGWIVGIALSVLVIVLVLGAFATRKKLKWDKE